MSSLSSSGGGFAFDTPQAVMHVLASIRKSDISPKDKNSLRDLVLSYTNGGKDPSLKIQIEKQLTSLAVKPLAQATIIPASQPVTLHPFGSSRNVPANFTASVTVAAPPQQSASDVVPAHAPAPAPVTQTASSSVIIPEQPIVPPAPQRIERSVDVAPAAQPITSASVTPPPLPSTDNAAALARVREIKAEVNERVGNPVNLVDIDNTVGREYMSALLDAMKKLSSGVNSASTMERLEAAFVEVKRVLEQPRPADVVTQPPTLVAPVPALVTLEPEPPTPTPVVEKPVAPAPVLEPVPQPVIPPQPAQPEPKAQPQSQPVVPLVAKQEPLRQSTPLEDRRWSAAAAVIKPAPIKPLSESATPLKSVEDVPTQDSITNKDADPLRSQEVNEGLNQLLSDWPLFKKSGLFGTGPSGVEHPLYKKIKDLQIPLLLAGRFEGATQEIKQSITDYMNGWRYEQGIIYEQGETFDHYLRRVIRHILDLQK